jgi:hypothetical protein
MAGITTLDTILNTPDLNGEVAVATVSTLDNESETESWEQTLPDIFRVFIQLGCRVGR